MKEIKAFTLDMLEMFFKRLAPILSRVEVLGFKMLIDRIKKNIDTPLYEKMLQELTGDFIGLIKRNQYIKDRLLAELK